LIIQRPTALAGHANRRTTHQVRSASFLEHLAPSVHGRCFFFFSSFHSSCSVYLADQASRRHLKKPEIFPMMVHFKNPGCSFGGLCSVQLHRSLLVLFPFSPSPFYYYDPPLLLLLLLLLFLYWPRRDILRPLAILPLNLLCSTHLHTGPRTRLLSKQLGNQHTLPIFHWRPTGQ
jgi:hypothetical protein